jgi:acyl-CoA reductase-like NAD-dependent aldehyde dehydrogenase
VPEAIYDEVCTELGKLAEKAIVGDGLEEGTEFGPIQNKTQYEKVKGYLEDARRNGKIVAGGETSRGRGYFVRPTIVRDIPETSALVREEQFGPILPVLSYSSLDEAIARANDTEYGLGATVWSSNLQRAYEVASRIESGTVWVNKHLDLPPDIPFAGAKQSGLGIEMGQEGLEEFTQQRVINMAK